MPQTFDEDDDLLEDSGSDDMEEGDDGEDLEFSDEDDEDGKISDGECLRAFGAFTRSLILFLFHPL